MQFKSLAVPALLLPLCGFGPMAAPVPQAAAQAAPTTKPTTAPAAIPYPLTTCIVSDEKLGEMGEPAVLVHEGQEFKFCCKSCVGDFKKDPAKYVKKLKDKAPKSN